ncbi:MAG: hypothetical protein ACYCQL_00360 [Acidithiobacillus sp.]
MNHRWSVIPVTVFLLASPLAMASTMLPSTSTAIHAHAGGQKRQKRITHIQARIARLEHRETILTSRSEALRRTKVARVKSRIAKLQARMARLQGK